MLSADKLNDQEYQQRIAHHPHILSVQSQDAVIEYPGFFSGDAIQGEDRPQDHEGIGNRIRPEEYPGKGDQQKCKYHLKSLVCKGRAVDGKFTYDPVAQLLCVNFKCLVKAVDSPPDQEGPVFAMPQSADQESKHNVERYPKLQRLSFCGAGYSRSERHNPAARC